MFREKGHPSLFTAVSYVIEKNLMPAIAQSINQSGSQFYRGLGDFRAVFGDEYVLHLLYSKTERG